MNDSRAVIGNFYVANLISVGLGSGSSEISDCKVFEYSLLIMYMRSIIFTHSFLNKENVFRLKFCY